MAELQLPLRTNGNRPAARAARTAAARRRASSKAVRISAADWAESSSMTSMSATKRPLLWRWLVSPA